MWILCCILLIVLGGLIWCALACAFKAVGKFSIKFFGDPFKIMNKREDEVDE